MNTIPMPWMTIENKIVDADYWLVAVIRRGDTMRDKEELAVFIARAVNCHAELVATLETAIGHMRDLGCDLDVPQQIIAVLERAKAKA